MQRGTLHRARVSAEKAVYGISYKGAKGRVADLAEGDYYNCMTGSTGRLP